MVDRKAFPLDTLGCHWRMKIWLAASLWLFYCTGYELVERYPLRSAVEFGLTPIDRWIGFSPGWIWVYESICLMAPAIWLATTRDEIKRYAIGFAAITMVGFSFFILWPVRCPRPDSTPAAGLYALQMRVDSPLNAFPSMHMAIAAYSACVAIGLSRGRCKRILAAGLPIWVLLIAYSALATKQHYLVDLPPGILLGWGAHRLAFKGLRQP
jgi:membrane-associated phospholipid phosphatase